MHDLVIRGGTVVIPSAPFAGSCSGRSPNLNKMHMQEIARCAWTERRENVIALGPSGTGKNYVALGLGLAAWRIFMALGLGFLFIEIAFIQRFILFLGHLLYAVAVVLAGFLVFAGDVSAVSGQLNRHAVSSASAVRSFAIDHVLTAGRLLQDTAWVPSRGE